MNQYLISPTKNIRKQNPLKIDLSKFTEQIKSIPVSSLNMLDGILSKLANHVYDTYEYMLDFPDNSKELSKEQAAAIINDLMELQSQVTPLMNILCDMDYNSKYMDRVKEELGTIEDEIPGLLTKLKRKAG